MCHNLHIQFLIKEHKTFLYWQSCNTDVHTCLFAYDQFCGRSLTLSKNIFDIYIYIYIYIIFDTGLLYYIWLYCTLQTLHFFTNWMVVTTLHCDNFASSKSAITIFPIVSVHSVSLCHILIILATFHIFFFILLYLLWWSVISDLWCYYCTCMEGATIHAHIRQWTFCCWVQTALLTSSPTSLPFLSPLFFETQEYWHCAMLSHSAVPNSLQPHGL